MISKRRGTAKRAIGLALAVVMLTGSLPVAALDIPAFTEQIQAEQSNMEFTVPLEPLQPAIESQPEKEDEKIPAEDAASREETAESQPEAGETEQPAEEAVTPESEPQQEPIQTEPEKTEEPANEEPAAVQNTTSFNYHDQFSTKTQNNGAWAYGYAEQGTVKLEQNIQYVSGRWANDTNGIRILSDGLMPGSKQLHPDAVAQWTAPQDGVVEITSGGIASVPYKSKPKGPLNAGTISMEEFARNDRDGVALSVLHNGTGIWPDTGAYRNKSNKEAFPFEPIRVKVAKGDTIWFRLCGNGGNNNYDNDRTFWNPCVSYVDAASVRMETPKVVANGEITASFANAASLKKEDVKLYAMINDGARKEVAVTDVQFAENTAVIRFEEITEGNAVVQLQVVALGDSRTVTFNTKDFAANQVEVTTKAGENGSVEPLGVFTMRRDESKEIRFVPNEGYEVYRVLVNGQAVAPELIQNNTYVLSNPTGNVTVEVVFKPVGQQGGVTYYVDAVNGSDDNAGTSEDKAWKSLDKVNVTVFNPGDKILFHAGQTWNGYLWPKGEGTEFAAITVSSYGGSGYPVINGNGTMPYNWDERGSQPTFTPTVLLSDQSHWVIENLEVTNSADATHNQVGILVFTTGRSGEVKNVTVQNCYVHDVTATRSNEKLTGGIIGTGLDTWIDGNPVEGAPTKEHGFNGLYFLNNHVKNVAKEGIRTSGGGSLFRNTYPHENVSISGNYIEEVYGDGIVLAEVSKNGLVEGNMVKNACNVSEANYAGAWSWYAKDTIYRYNEVFGIDYGYNDGEAFDFDLGCDRVTYMHNYSHNNVGGFLLTMGGQGKASNTFAYNISANDGKPSQELFHVAVNDLRIYNNTMYIGKGVSTHLFGEGNVNFFKNNIVLSHGKLLDLFTGSGRLNAGVENNIFYPSSITSSMSDEVLAKNIVKDPKLSGPSLIDDPKYSDAQGVTYENMGSGEAYLAGLRERASIFKLTADSPAIDAGVKIDNLYNGKYEITEDLFGNPIKGNPDIGAHEFTNDPGPSDPNVELPTTIQLDQTELHMLSGDTAVLKAAVGPNTALDSSVTFESSAPEVAGVTAGGKIIAISEGKAVITAVSNANPKLTASCSVKVYTRSGSTLTAVKDGQSRDNSRPSDTNGTGSTLFVKNDSHGYRSRAIVGFDISGLNADFANAVLQLKAESVRSSIEIAFTEVNDSAWNEKDMIQWNAIDDKAFRGEKVKTAKLSTADQGKFVEIDFTDYIKNKLAKGETKFSLLMEVVSAGGSNSQVTFASREAGEEVAPKIITSNDTVLNAENVVLYTAVGQAPELPATVKATYMDGSKKDAAVEWEKVDPSLYAKEGQYTVLGFIKGRTLPVVANVTVDNHVIVRVDDVVITTPAGAAPELPKMVTVHYIDGTTAQAAIVWGTFDESSYASEGMSFKVQGTVDGYQGKVTAKVSVVAAAAVKAQKAAVNGIAGYAPMLPESVQVVYSDNTVKNEAVAWSENELFNKPETFAVKGTTASGLDAECEVTLYEQNGPVKTIQMENPKGKYPTLPKSVQVPVKAECQTIEMPVVWETVSEKTYCNEDAYTVNGSVCGTQIPVVAQVASTQALKPVAGEVAVAEDAHIQAAPSNKTDGKSSILSIKNTTYDKHYKRDGVVKFNLSGVEGGAENLTDLTLKLYLERRENNGSSGTTSYLNVWATGTGWKEETASWDGVTQSNYKYKLIAQDVPVTLDQNGSYIEISVSEAIEYLDKDGNIAFALSIDRNPVENPDGDNSGLVFHSHENESGKAPLLAYSNRYITKMDEVKAEVAEGEQPQLPGEITVTWSDGVQETVKVQWDKLPDSAYAQAGKVLVNGKAEGVYAPIAAVITVTAPEPTPSPEPTPEPTPEPSAKPDPTPVPTVAPNPTAAPNPNPNPMPTPGATAKPEWKPTEPPKATEAPEPEVSAEPDPTEEPKPEPEKTPDPTQEPAEDTSAQTEEKTGFAWWILLLVLAVLVVILIVWIRSRRKE